MDSAYDPAEIEDGGQLEPKVYKIGVLKAAALSISGLSPSEKKASLGVPCGGKGRNLLLLAHFAFRGSNFLHVLEVMHSNANYLGKRLCLSCPIALSRSNGLGSGLGGEFENL